MELLSDLVGLLLMLGVTHWRLLPAVDAQDSTQEDSELCPFVLQTPCRYNNGSCLCILDSNLRGDFTSVYYHCARALGAVPATIRNEQDNTIFAEMMVHRTRGAWIGIKGTKGSYTWQQRTPVEYVNFVNSTQETENNSCHVMLPGDAHWWPKPCTQVYDPACSRPAITPRLRKPDPVFTETATQGTTSKDSEFCPFSLNIPCRYSNGSCLCILDYQYTGGCQSAETYCAKSLGGGPATIRNEQDNVIFQDMLKNQTQAFWIGLRGGNGAYTWHDGTPVVFMNFGNDSAETDENACHVFLPEDGTWWPRPAEESHRIACTTVAIIPPSPTPSTAPTTPTTTPTTHSTSPASTPSKGPCPYHEEAMCQLVSDSCLCVLLTSETIGNYFYGEKMCAIHSMGVFASILSEDENNLLRAMIQNISHGVWIGLSGKEGSFVWMDQNNVTYTNLAETSRKEEDDDCYYVSNKDGLWYRTNCMNNNYGASCKYKADSTVKPSATIPMSTVRPPGGQGGLSSAVVAIIVVAVLLPIIFVSVLSAIWLKKKNPPQRKGSFRNLIAYAEG